MLDVADVRELIDNAQQKRLLLSCEARMTKDGRSSRIDDIRYFHGETRHSGYLNGHEDAVAFGRRFAWLLNGEGVSLGAYTALYVLLTPSLSPGEIEITDFGGDWWQRYTHVGVPREFPNVPDSTDIIVHGTIAAVKAIRPDLESLIEEAGHIAREHGDSLRFLLKVRQAKRYNIEVSCRIGVWPNPSAICVSLTDRSSGMFLDAPPISVDFYHQAFNLAGAIRVVETATEHSLGQSMAARLSSAANGGSLVIPVSEFVPSARPVFSKLIKRRG
jgi:hypothetical protein